MIELEIVDENTSCRIVFRGVDEDACQRALSEWETTGAATWAESHPL